jgi:hypothetical protein
VYLTRGEGAPRGRRLYTNVVRCFASKSDAGEQDCEMQRSSYVEIACFMLVGSRLCLPITESQGQANH